MITKTDIAELDVIDASALPPQSKFLAQTVWAVRNFLRERKSTRSLQDWTVVDIIEEIKSAVREVA